MRLLITVNVSYFGKKPVLVEKKVFFQQRFFAVVVCQYVKCYIDKNFFQIQTDDFDSYLNSWRQLNLPAEYSGA